MKEEKFRKREERDSLGLVRREKSKDEERVKIWGIRKEKQKEEEMKDSCLHGLDRFKLAEV